MPSTKPHVILVGGFLGAGKTSAMVALAHWLADQGIRAGFVTNDQGSDLVDTRLLQYCGMATEEIAGGCFCCRFNELVDATHRLRAVLRPDVFVAEAVGSCTDLAATVSYPMRRLLGDECTIGPLSVLVDPERARREFGLASGDNFSDNVRYIYRKQLEEADVIVISKSDLVSTSEALELQTVLETKYPHADVVAVSVHDHRALDGWFRRILFQEQRPRAVMAVDYDLYADGEARLGWLNAAVEASSGSAADGNELLVNLAAQLQRGLQDASSAIAHLKMTLHAGDQLASINLVRNDLVPELGASVAQLVLEGRVTINLRAEAAPEVIERVLRHALTTVAGWQLRLDHVEAFRPGRPAPTHRDTVTPWST